MNAFILKPLILGLILLCFSGQSFGSLACRELLKPSVSAQAGLTYTNIVRPTEEMLDQEQNWAIINKYQDFVVSLNMGLQPHVREQCLGTCYLYASQVVIENQLKRARMIPIDSVALMGPVIGEVGVERLSQLTSRSFTAEGLLNGGVLEGFHIAGSKPFYFIRQSQIKILGGAERVLELEREFLRDFVEMEKGVFLGKTYRQHLLTSPLSIGKVMSDAFMAYVQRETNLLIGFDSVRLRYLEYVSITYKKTVGSIFAELRSTYNQEAELSNDSLKVIKAGSFNGALLSEFVYRLEEGSMINLGLSPAVFGGDHAVVLTNLVIDRSRNELLGFVYLNSHSQSFGLQGYGYIHAAEVVKYVDSFEIITGVEAN